MEKCSGLPHRWVYGAIPLFLPSIFLTCFPLPQIQLGVWKSAVGSIGAEYGAKPGRERIFVFFRLGNRGRKQRFPVRLTSTATARLSASRLHLAQAFRRAPTFMGCTQQASKVVGSGLTIPPPRKLTPRIEYVYHIWRYFESKRCRQTATSSTENSHPHV